MSKAENAVSRQGDIVRAEGTIRYSLRNERTGQVAWHLQYTDIFDAVQTARYWHAAGWRVTVIVMKEKRP